MQKIQWWYIQSFPSRPTWVSIGWADFPTLSPLSHPEGNAPAWCPTKWFLTQHMSSVAFHRNFNHGKKKSESQKPLEFEATKTVSMQPGVISTIPSCGTNRLKSKNLVDIFFFCFRKGETIHSHPKLHQFVGSFGFYNAAPHRDHRQATTHW